MKPEPNSPQIKPLEKAVFFTETSSNDLKLDTASLTQTKKNQKPISYLPTGEISLEGLKTNFNRGFEMKTTIKERSENKFLESEAPILNTKPYVFPNLTPAEVKKNHDQKEDMMKAYVKSVLKNRGGDYSYIPSGSFENEGKKISVQSYWMKSTEVTNLEYRVFLFDLLINNKKEAFLQAKPNQELWVSVLGKGHQAMQRFLFFK